MSKFRHAIWKGNLLAGKGNKFSAKGNSHSAKKFWRVFCRTYLRRVEISMLAFRLKIIDFGVFFAALTFGVSKFRCSNFDEKSSFLACLLPHLPSACRNFDARISTKNHRFWRAFCRTYLRRVEISMLVFDDFGHLSAPVFERFSVCRWWFFRWKSISPVNEIELHFLTLYRVYDTLFRAT